MPAVSTPRSLPLARADMPTTLDRPAGTLGETRLVRVKQIEQARADGAKAGDAQGERLLHGIARSYRLAFC